MRILILSLMLSGCTWNLSGHDKTRTGLVECETDCEGMETRCMFNLNTNDIVHEEGRKVDGPVPVP